MPRFISLLPGCILLLLSTSVIAQDPLDLLATLDPDVAKALATELPNTDEKVKNAAESAFNDGNFKGALEALKDAGLDVPAGEIEGAIQAANIDAKAKKAADSAFKDGNAKGVLEALKDAGLHVPAGDIEEAIKHAASLAEGIVKDVQKKIKKAADDPDTVTTKSCFPAAATAERPDGTRARMDGLRVGDRVRVAAGGGPDAFSWIFLFTHADPGYAGRDFVRVEAKGRVLTAAAGHFVYKVGADGLEEVDVEMLKVGESVVVGGVPVVVEKVQKVAGKGLYNPQTVHGDIVVDGFLATTYTSAVKAEVAHALLAPVRAAYMTVGLDLSLAFKIFARYVR